MESLHSGHIALWGQEGLEAGWGDPGAVIYPRSTAKIIQALPLVETGLADQAGLGPEHLALACASHTGAAIHTDRVDAWLARQGFTDDDLRCGPQMPDDKPAAKALLCSGGHPRQAHNNCSGKHTGFLMLARALGGGPEYNEIDHPVQKAVRAAWEDVTGEPVHGWAIDGCSAPNFATSLQALARAMAFVAAARAESPDPRTRAAARLRLAMQAHPELVAGEGTTCTGLMRAMDGRAVVKSGAEAVYVAILPDQRRGIALKITDGADRAAETAMATLLVRLGALDPDHPQAKALIDGPIRNRRGLVTGAIRPATALRA